MSDFQAALAVWLRDCLVDSETEGVLAVDGKGLDENGRPLHMLNAFVHDLQAVVGQWSTGAEKTNEPTLLRRHLEALLDTYPMLQLITGDAIFAQRPLAELICAKNRDYLLQIKATPSSIASLKRPIAHQQPKRPKKGALAEYGRTGTECLNK